MINMNSLRNDYFNNSKSSSTREGFGDGLLEIGSDPKVFALCADLTDSVKMDKFKKEYSDRFVEVGIAEQNMASVGSGIAAMGMIPYIASYASFNPGRNWEQIRTTVAYNNLPVRIIGAHAGLMTGPDGGTHQALEDVALMRVIPNMTVLIPADYNEAKAMTIASLKMKGPVYIRLTREKAEEIYTDNYEYNSKASIVYKNDVNNPTYKVLIISAGPIINEAILAAKDYSKTSISVDVMNCGTVKPLDESSIKRAAEIYKKIVVVEEHQEAGGLYSAISELLAKTLPTKLYPVCVKDRFGQSGTYHELWDEYGISKEYIKEAISKIILN